MGFSLYIMQNTAHYCMYLYQINCSKYFKFKKELPKKNKNVSKISTPIRSNQNMQIKAVVFFLEN